MCIFQIPFTNVRHYLDEGISQPRFKELSNSKKCGHGNLMVAILYWMNFWNQTEHVAAYIGSDSLATFTGLTCVASYYCISFVIHILCMVLE